MSVATSLHDAPSVSVPARPEPLRIVPRETALIDDAAQVAARLVDEEAALAGQSDASAELTGAAQARLSDAERALALGLIHECCAPEQLDTRIEQLATALARGAPRALAEAKQLLGALAIQGGPGDDAVLYDCARRIARLRASEEAREGLDAFLHKRAPNWIED